MSVGGEERRFVWGRPGHWSAPGPQPLPACSLPEEAELAAPGRPQGPHSPSAALVPTASRPRGPRSPGPPASEDTGLVGRPRWAPACSSTGRSGAPMSWRRCPAPWPGWSWGPWSVSPGAPPWTSSRTSGVGVGPFPGGIRGSHLVYLATSLWSEPAAGTVHVPLSVARSVGVWGPGPLPRAAAGGGEGPQHEDPEGLGSRAGRAVWAPTAGLEQGRQGAGFGAELGLCPPLTGDGTRSSGPFMSEAPDTDHSRPVPCRHGGRCLILPPADRGEGPGGAGQLVGTQRHTAHMWVPTGLSRSREALGKPCRRCQRRPGVVRGLAGVTQSRHSPCGMLLLPTNQRPGRARGFQLATESLWMRRGPGSQVRPAAAAGVVRASGLSSSGAPAGRSRGLSQCSVPRLGGLF